MANFIVVSPSQTTDGGNSGDLFVFRSGAASAATLNGGAGNDTIDLLAGGSAKGGVFKTTGGADLVQASAVGFSGSTLSLGAGADTIALSGASNLETVNFGDGSDVLVAKGATTAQGNIGFGAGSDLVTAASLFTLSGDSLLMGSGKDTITLSNIDADSGQIVGGGGADKIDIQLNGTNDATIKGGAGGDTIQISAAINSARIFGGNGSDNLALSGSIVGTGAVSLGKGADTVTFETFNGAVGLSIGGGAGADNISFNTAGAGIEVKGGGGNDSITFDLQNVAAIASAGAAEYSAGAGLYATINGGVGADSITFSGIQTQSAGMRGVIQFDTLADSTEASMDMISFNKSAGGDTIQAMLLDFSGSFATGIAASLSNGTLTTNAKGFLNGAGDNSSVSERVSAMNSLIAATGTFGTFKDASGSAAYLFVQGGSTDMLVKFSPTGAATTSAGTVQLSAQGADGSFKISFD